MKAQIIRDKRHINQFLDLSILTQIRKPDSHVSGAFYVYTHMHIKEFSSKVIYWNMCR